VEVTNLNSLGRFLGYFLIWQGTTRAQSRPTQLRRKAAKSKNSQVDCNFISFPSLEHHAQQKIDTIKIVYILAAGNYLQLHFIQQRPLKINKIPN
jgi:hypothetical protein